MDTQIETWKRIIPALRACAIVLVLAGLVGGSAMASEEPSFTARVQA